MVSSCMILNSMFHKEQGIPWSSRQLWVSQDCSRWNYLAQIMDRVYTLRILILKCLSFLETYFHCTSILYYRSLMFVDARNSHHARDTRGSGLFSWIWVSTTAKLEHGVQNWFSWGREQKGMRKISQECMISVRSSADDSFLCSLCLLTVDFPIHYQTKLTLLFCILYKW